MFRLESRWSHYALLAAAHLLMTLPNLGTHSLWDMDEGINAEAAREMLESGNWITPYFNYELRTGKPALMYWFVCFSFQIFGINEFAARLPSVIFGLGTVSVTYELARKMFSRSTGLIAAFALASCFEFCLISHAATPDSPFVFFLTCSFYLYWIGSEGVRRWWFVPFGAATGFAVLTKGPIGLGMPGLVVLAQLAWTGRLRTLWDRRLLYGALMFIAVAGPWYGMVMLDTKGRWLQAFLWTDNLVRFSQPADNHSGGPFYHVITIVVMFAPWIVFLPAAIWYGVREARRPQTEEVEAARKYRFLFAWVLAFLIVFSIAATKLPNYVLPLYPALAILAARFLDRWRLGLLQVPNWVIIETILATTSVGVIMFLGLLFVSGLVAIPVPVKGFHPFTSLAGSIPISLIPLVTAVLAWRFVRAGRRDAAVSTFVSGAIALVALVAAIPTVAMQDSKVPNHFAEEAGLYQPNREIRIASCRWLRHSMVFYAQREITRIDDFRRASEYLALPRPTYLIVPENVWEELSKSIATPVRIISKRYDMYSRQQILVVANRYAVPES